MSERSAIEWTDSTWNPIRARLRNEDWERDLIGWHCLKVSPGCQNCYAERLNKRLGTREPYLPGRSEPFLSETILTEPLRWRKPRRVFVCSMSDLFGEWVPDEWIDRIFAVMSLAPQHTFQVLTKRAARMREYVESRAANDNAEPVRIALTAFHPKRKPNGEMMYCAGIIWPLPNVWLGVSAEDQQRLDERVPELLQTPAAVKWVSAEPLLGPLDFSPPAPKAYGILSRYYGPDGFDKSGSQAEKTRREGLFPRIDWVVAGSESGPGRRETDGAWVRTIRDQCVAAGVPFFLKQLHEGGKKLSLPELDGRTWDEFPGGARSEEKAT
jgi:protein gp37